MEDNRLEKILEIKVDVSEAIKGIGRLNEEISKQRDLQAQLKKDIKELQEKEGDHTAEIEKKRIELAQSNELTKTYSGEVQRLSKIVQNQLKMDKEEVGSLQRKRAELSKLTLEYDELADAERDAAKGQELRDKINAVTKELKEAEEATQRYYRNVGNYENAIKNSLGLNSKLGNTLKNVADATKNGVGPALNEMSQGVKNVGKETTKLLANPIVATLALIAAAVMAVVKGIKSSEENTAKWSATMAKFKPFVDLVTVACQKFAGVILDIIGGIGKATGAVMKWLEKLPLVGDNIAAINAESERYIELEKDKYELNKAARDLEVESAKAARDVAELRTKAKDKENYTDQERLKFVQEANRIETEIAEKKKAAAEENLRILQEEAKATQNQKQVEEEMARAQAAVYQAETEYNTKIRELLEQENTIKNEIAAKDKARVDEAKRLNDEKKKQQKEYNEALEEAYKETQDMLIELIQDSVIKEEELERTRYERQIESIKRKQEQYSEEDAMYQEYALQLELAAQQHAINMQTISTEQRMREVEEAEKAAEEQKKIQEELVAKEIELQKLKLSSYSSIAGSISAILDATAGDNKKRLKAAKIAALGEVALNQGIAIAQAVKAGGEYPFPMNLITIASSVAGAVAALIPAIQAVNSVKLARGGHVSGPGTSTSDSVPAMLSNGEFVVNARATSMFPELLETINNLGLGIASPARLETAYQARQEAMTLDMMIKAFKHLPRPVVSVEEYSRVENRVDTLENLTKL